MVEYPYFAEKNELHAWLVKNKDKLVAQKKSQMKHADGIVFHNLYRRDQKTGEFKATSILDPEKVDEIKVRAVINTTNIMDSHLDVHIPGLWKKSLSENKALMHLMEHKMGFAYILAEDENLKVYTEKFTWKDLGYPKFEGETEALVFDSTLRKSDYIYSTQQEGFKLYARGRVKQHSVGMQYVKIVLAINNEDYGAEYEAWEKYFPMIVNQQFAEDTGFFWAIKEAKAIEGSAVPRGSNYATPTLDNNMKDTPEPTSGHSGKTEETEPPQSTPVIDYKFLKERLTLNF
jgi:hypothetical protein